MWVISLLHFCESWDATKIFRLGVQYFTCWYTLVNMKAVLKGNACWSHEITEIGSYNMGLHIWVCECVSVYVCVCACVFVLFSTMFRLLSFLVLWKFHWKLSSALWNKRQSPTYRCHIYRSSVQGKPNIQCLVS